MCAHFGGQNPAGTLLGGWARGTASDDETFRCAATTHFDYSAAIITQRWYCNSSALRGAEVNQLRVLSAVEIWK